MTGRRRISLVEARADLILGGEPTAEAYAAHFEAQMRRGAVRKVLCIGYLARSPGPQRAIRRGPGLACAGGQPALYEISSFTAAM
ncbi:MAG TPA: hypothetical protein VMC83_27690 [Streptosporangiaceae bacterium]|nr:hypothetical protein [Streptosporangiaceae bacterium]